METRTSGTKVILGLILAGSAVAGKACVFQEDPGPEAPIPLDRPLAPGETRGGLMTKESELVRGVTAKARVGDYKLYNDQVALTVGRAGISRGYHPYGGQILDVDRVRFWRRQVLLR